MFKISKPILTENDMIIYDAMEKGKEYTSQLLGKKVNFADQTIKKILYKLTALNFTEMDIAYTRQSSTGYKYQWRRKK